MINELKQDIEKWINNWVSVYNEQLGTIPCPFAKQALEAKKVDFATAQDLTGVYGLCKLYAAGGLNGDMLIIGMKRDAAPAENLFNFIENVNNNVLLPANLVALEDHPDEDEIVNGVKMNQGKWILIFIQSLVKLNQASLMLQKQGYYNNWSQEAYDNVVSWRFKKE